MCKLIMSLLFLICVLSTSAVTTKAQDSEMITVQNANQLTQIGQLGHGTITTSVWSEDAQMLAIGMSREIRIYRPDQSEPVIISGQQMIRELIFRQDNQVLASSDSTGLVQLWDTQTGGELAVWGKENVGTASDLYFIPNTEILAINFFDVRELFTARTFGTGIRFWDYEASDTPMIIPTSNYRGESNMTLNNDQSVIATTISDSQQGSGAPIATIIIRAVSSGEIVYQLGGVRPFFRQLVFSPTDPDLLVSIDVRGVVRFWNVEHGVELFALTLPYNRVTTAAFSVDGSSIVTGGTDGKMRVWRVSDGALLEVLDNQPWQIQYIRVTAIEDIYGFSDPASIAEVWNARTGAVITSYKINDVTPRLMDIGFDPAGERLVGVGEDATIRIWQIATGAETLSMRINPDDWDHASVTDSGTSIVWMDAETGGVWILKPWEFTTPFSYQFQAVTGIGKIGLSPGDTHLLISSYGDGRLYDPYSGEPSVGGQLRMWDIRESQPDDGVLLVEDSVEFAYSPTEPAIVYSSRGRLWWRGLHEAEAVALTDGEQWDPTSIAFSPDGSILAAVYSLSIKLYNTQNWTVIREIRPDFSASESPIAFNVDGSLLAFASRKTVKVFEVETGNLLITLESHVDDITNFAFDPSGSLIATSSLDGTIAVWGIK